MRTLWIIDAGYAAALQKKLDIEIDFLKLKKILNKALGKNNEVSEAYYMTSVDKADMDQKAFLTWLQQAEPIGPKIQVKNYELKLMACRCPQCSYEFDRKVQKGVDVGIATLILKLIQNYDRLVLFGGDGDFYDAISYIKDQNKEFWLIGLQRHSSSELQSLSNNVIWLDTEEVTAKIIKNRSERSQSKEQVATKAKNQEQNSIKNEPTEYSKPLERIPSGDTREEYRPERRSSPNYHRYKKNDGYRSTNYSNANRKRYPRSNTNAYNRDEDQQPDSYESALGANALKQQKFKPRSSATSSRGHSQGYSSRKDGSFLGGHSGPSSKRGFPGKADSERSFSHSRKDSTYKQPTRYLPRKQKNRDFEP